MSNALVIPANATRAQVKTLISEMKSAAVHALSAASTAAARESFITTCYAIAIQRAVFGSDEIFRNIRSKALTLPDYIGKLLHAYGEALAVGKSMADSFPMAEDDCDLSVFLNSPTFGALIEALGKSGVIV